jgi:trans-2,3-dihydro-3-hydroxyanthranilate isomerase
VHSSLHGRPIDPERSRHERELPFALYDSFALTRFSGNVAGVVQAHPLPAEPIMQAIAAELGAPTTGFIDATGADPPTVRFFTPRREIHACGHVSLAAAVQLVAMGDCPVAEDRRTEATLRTAAGPLHVRLFRDGPDVRVALRYSPRLVGSAEPFRGKIEETLGIQTDASLPVEIVDTGLRHLVVAYRSVQDLTELRVADEPLRMLAESTGADTICAFAPRGSGRFRMRDLTAAIGASEEPASGTTSSALAQYARAHDLLREQTASIEQGVEMGRPSSIEVELEEGSSAGCAWVSGTAIRTAVGCISYSDLETSSNAVDLYRM